MVCPCTLYSACEVCPGTSELVGQHQQQGFCPQLPASLPPEVQSAHVFLQIIKILASRHVHWFVWCLGKIICCLCFAVHIGDFRQGFIMTGVLLLLVGMNTREKHCCNEQQAVKSWEVGWTMLWEVHSENLNGVRIGIANWDNQLLNQTHPFTFFLAPVELVLL